MRLEIFFSLAALAPSLLLSVAADCVKFRTNGFSAASYDYYRFYDFRNLREIQNVPTFLPSTQKARTFSTVPWKAGWEARSWLSPASQTQSVDLQHTPSQMYISRNTGVPQDPLTYLTLRTTRLSKQTQSAAELNYMERNVTHASIRLSGRVRGTSGAVAGFFTYRNDTVKSDIEILTRDPALQVRYSNQPTEDPNTGKSIGGSVFNRSTTHKTTSEWNVHRLDWVSGLSVWYLNGSPAAMTNVNVPSAASMIIINLWSNGGSFSREMEIGGEAWFDVQWVELMFNDGSSSTTKGVGEVCPSESSPGFLVLV